MARRRYRLVDLILLLVIVLLFALGSYFGVIGPAIVE
jgi:hypothetical protein